MAIPPKILKEQLRSLDRTSNGIEIEEENPLGMEDGTSDMEEQVDGERELLSNELPVFRTGNKALRTRPHVDIERTPKSLPVLAAFQEFLDSERRRARNLMITLSMFFVAVLLSVLATSLFVGMTFLNQIRGDFRDVQSDVNVSREMSMKTRSDTESVLASFASDATNLRDDYDGKLKQVMEEVATFELENSSLKKEMDNLMTRLEALNISLESVDEHRISSPADSTIAMSIVPRGGNRSTAWRLPIPE